MRGPKRRNETLVPLPPLLDFSVAGPAVSFRARRKPLLHAWRDKVRVAAMAAHGGELLSGGLTVWITEFSQIATKDRDNLAKPMLDAMQGVIYADDRQVLELHVDWSDIDGSLYRAAYVARRRRRLEQRRRIPLAEGGATCSEDGPSVVTKASLTPEETKIRAVARQYRRKGYTALVPRGPIELPQGLEGYVPDLIATNGRETVLVEVKQSDAVRKANDLTLVADRVARLPGWRFELVAIAPEPIGRLATREQLAALADKVDRALAAGLSDMALNYAVHAAALLITEAGRLEGLKVDHMATRDVARELVVRGVLPTPLFESFDLAWRRRGELMHLDPTELAPSSEEVRQVMRLIENLRAELDVEPAAA